MNELSAFEELQRDLRLTKDRLSDAVKEINASRELLRSQRWVMRGMCDQTFHLKVTLSPQIFDEQSFEIVQELIRQHAKHCAHEVEKLLGSPIAELRDALLHINYLENHARHNNLPFSPFPRRPHDRDLMNAL